MFDVLAYLESQGVPHWTSGKNVSEGWVNIRCIYCDDKSNHLGINLTTGVHNCWKCGRIGGPARLIVALERCSFKKAYAILETFKTEGTQVYSKPASMAPPGAFELPKLTIETLPDTHRAYLISRGFDPDQLVADYGIKATLNIGQYRQRIIIPIFFDRELVNFVARDITGNFEHRYLMPKTSEVLLRRDQLLYDVDRIGKSIAIVEGVFDAWRIGRGAVATFGTRVTDEQCNILYRKKVERVFIIFDHDASLNEGHKLAKKLSHVIPHVENLTISEGDPDSYFLNNPEDLKEIKFLLG